MLPLLAAVGLGLLAWLIGLSGSDSTEPAPSPDHSRATAPLPPPTPPAPDGVAASSPPAASADPSSAQAADPAPVADFGQAMARVTALMADPDDAGPDVARCAVPTSVDAGEDAVLVQDDRGQVGPFPPVGIVRDDRLLLVGPPGDGTGQALTRGGAVMEISWSFPADGSQASCEVGGIGDDEWWATVHLSEPCPGLCLLTTRNCRALVWADSEQAWRLQTGDDQCSVRALVLVDGTERATGPHVVAVPEDGGDAALTLGPAEAIREDDPLADAFSRRTQAFRHACAEVGEVHDEAALGSCDGA